MKSTDAGMYDSCSIDLSPIWHLYCVERSRNVGNPFYEQDLDGLIWETCIIGGPPAFRDLSDDYHARVEQYFKLYRKLTRVYIKEHEEPLYVPYRLIGCMMFFANKLTVKGVGSLW